MTRSQDTKRPVAVVGIVGHKLDGSGRRNRWDTWRPSVAIAQQPDLLVARFDLLHLPGDASLAGIVARDIARVSPDTQVVRRELAIDDPWDLEEVYAALFDFAVERDVDPEAEDLLVHVSTGTHIWQICLFLMVEARLLPGQLLQMRPPQGGEGIEGGHARVDLDLARYDRIARRFEEQRRGATSMLKAGIATRNARFNALVDELERVAEGSREPILLLGPTGAGKSQLARQLYELKRARHELGGPFVEVNCATLRGDAASSALFGHVRGAFTGAESAREGLLRTADGGLLFLDEIGELGLDEQAMLLRAIEEGTFLPVGADATVTSHFQLVCGTNRDLAEEVRRGTFRDDLLARIDLWTFRLPALAERLEDLEPNLDHALESESRRRGAVVALNREAREQFLAFATGPRGAWTRNFRDLNGSVARMATLARAGRIDRAVVDAEIERLERAWSGGAALPVGSGLGTSGAGSGPSRVERHLGAAAAELDLFDRLQLEQVLIVCERCATLSEAGRLLFDRSRERRASTNDADRLRKFLVRMGVEPGGVLAGSNRPSTSG
ncbi:Nitrogen assimilation regulatory protein [Planctomycetes bacterium Pla163]|uniref:Nitrogen assimilation regulatory protein n=1 Tax=Rohdeia mirabilis TaxID=2528008 RepID=A0A518CYH1_9BACT|nr:Nitrogen assimilation regulatory protein [Planctomycetes bacterium Pla163]